LTILATVDVREVAHRAVFTRQFSLLVFKLDLFSFVVQFVVQQIQQQIGEMESERNW